MLTSLSIQNFAIVSTLELDLRSGMTAFTGETGAGKSIMIDALMLALGARADSSVIRPGEEQCTICACFEYDKGSVPEQWLRAHDINADEKIIYLRRTIHREGRSKSYINGQPFPLQKVKELAQSLVDIHGQHQHQTLLNHPIHRMQLDTYAGHSTLQEAVENAYRKCQALQKELNQLEEMGANKERIALLRFQIEELRNLSPIEGEFKALHEEHKLLNHARDYLGCLQEINQHLNSEESFGINRSLNQVLNLLSTLPQDQSAVKSGLELINSALIQCDEALDELNRFSEQVQLDPERLQALEERISVLHQAARKYQVEASQLPQLLEQLNAEFQSLENADAHKAELISMLEKERQTYQSAAEALRVSRIKFAALLGEEISQTICQLGMPHGYIELAITPLDKMQAHGQDKVEYKVCTNPGMQPDTLNKVASGGELSRISLAIQMITAQRGSTPTLLFDEVDVGIGGATAALVGQLLRRLGERLQVFCVTHQPQVASCANHHYLVEKKTQSSKTFSRVIFLNEEQRVHEIARMLGGLQVTEQTRTHAKEMLSAVYS